MEEILNKYPLLKDQNVPRETLLEFESFIEMLQKKNEEINIISKETAKNAVIRERHIVDSAQVIDLIDLNSNTITDIGSGGGMPGIIISILTKRLNKTLKSNLYEKSHHKSAFLRSVSRDLKLNTEIIQKNIFEEHNIETGTVMARAFKPLPITLELVYKNFSSYTNLIVFMGKNGEKTLEEARENWEFDFEKKKSVTSKDSFLLNIKNIKKNIKTNMQIISIINQKGGVGKTTTVINLAAGLAQLEKKVLVIDLDPQGNATTGLGLSNLENSDETIYGVLNGSKSILEVIKKTEIKNLDIVTSNVDLSGLEVETAGDNQRAFILKVKLTPYLNDSRGSYDYILIDCPPSLSLLTVMALASSHSLVVPLQTEFFALEGLTQLMKTIERVKVSVNPELRIRGILLTMYDKRNKLSSQVEKEARDYFSDKVYHTVIPRNVRLSEAPSHGMPVLIYDKTCLGSKSYFSFTDEFINQEGKEGSTA